MSDALQALLDSGARSTSRSARSYALCLKLARPDAYFRERRKSSRPSDEKIEPDSHSLFDLSFTPVVPVVHGRFDVTFDDLSTIFRTGAAHIVLLGPIRIAQRPRQRTPGTLPNPECRA